MSKMDNLRAMREARYEQARARAGKRRPRAAAASVPKRSAAPAEARPLRRPTPPRRPSEALCGHRNMGGRTCTREAGHAAKSHRYA